MTFVVKHKGNYARRNLLSYIALLHILFQRKRICLTITDTEAECIDCWESLISPLKNLSMPSEFLFQPLWFVYLSYKHFKALVISVLSFKCVLSRLKWSRFVLGILRIIPKKNITIGVYERVPGKA